jgi:hypothetical protein
MVISDPGLKAPSAPVDPLSKAAAVVAKPAENASSARARKNLGYMGVLRDA